MRIRDRRVMRLAFARVTGACDKLADSNGGALSNAILRDRISAVTIWCRGVVGSGRSAGWNEPHLLTFQSRNFPGVHFRMVRWYPSRSRI